MSEPAKIFNDRIEPGVVRVEFFDDDGGCEVTLFSGPRARERALSFGRTFYGTVDVADDLAS